MKNTWSPRPPLSMMARVHVGFYFVPLSTITASTPSIIDRGGRGDSDTNVALICHTLTRCGTNYANL